MYEGFLKFGGVEVINRARTAAYLRALVPGVDVFCTDTVLPAALGHSDYVDPATDGAPWYRGQRPSAARFYGLFPSKIQGAENSTRSLNVTELSGDGAIMTAPRYGSGEIRVVARAYAADEEAMMDGMAWLRDVLAGDGCSGADLGCTGKDLLMFAALPADAVAAYSLTRVFHRVEVTDPLKVTGKLNSKHALVWEVEFTLTVGVPWPFTLPTSVGSLAMDAAVSFTDPVGENCAAKDGAYDAFVADPYFTGISKPPRPPVILPPNILTISSWRRLSLPIPASQTQRWGKVAPIINVVTGAALQQLRLRFYKAGAVGCDYAGEFIVSYIPANSTLLLDSATRTAMLTLPGGKTSPAGNLLFGSAGKPFLWPVLGCHDAYTMTADLMPGQSGAVVLLETSVRE